MSHVRTLNHATSENLYAADERRSGIRTTIDHDDASESQTQAWPPNSPMDELTSTSHAYSGYPYQDYNSTSNFSSIDSYVGLADIESDQRLAGWSNAASQAGSLVDTTSGTHESRGYFNGPMSSELQSQWYYQEPRLPQELESLYPHFDARLLNLDLEQPPWSTYHAADQSYIPTHTYQGENSSGAAAQVGETDIDRITSSTLLATTDHGQHSRDIIDTPMRRITAFARDTWSLILPSADDTDKSETQLDTPPRSPAPASEPLHCPYCSAQFTGVHRKGNFGRHRRQKHSEMLRRHICEADGCSKVFMRLDARLKHYRKSHPELVPATPEGTLSNEQHHNPENLAGHALPRQDVKDRNRRTNDIDRDRDEKRRLVSPMSAMPSRRRYSNLDALASAPPTPTILTRRPSAETDHETTPNPKCSDCDITFNRRADLRRHVAEAHNPDPPKYPCAIPGCPRASHGFPRKDKLWHHMKRVHSPSNSLAHSQPSGVKHTCFEQGCAREFDQRADLLRHQRTHTDMSERPHKCGQCDKSFLYPKDLKRHEATHLGDQDEEKPSFHCTVTSCEYGPGGSGFSRKDGMLRHMKRFHPEWKE